MSTSDEPTWQPHRDPGDLSGLDASSQALNRTVDALSEEDLAGASLLPGWTRAHVVAHLALNAIALAGCLIGRERGERVAMYPSDEQRDADIEELARAGGSELRERLLEGTTRFAEAVAEVTDWSGTIDRLPGSGLWTVVNVVPTRRREVEIHHVDLATSYGLADWSEEFTAELLEAVTRDHADATPFVVRATDLGRDWTVGGESGEVGPGATTVMGTGADLGWWLTGRGAGEGLTCDRGLPSLGPWRRASVTAHPTQER